MRGLGNVNEGEGALHVRLVLDLLVSEFPVYCTLYLPRLLEELGCGVAVSQGPMRLLCETTDRRPRTVHRLLESATNISQIQLLSSREHTLPNS